MYTRLRNFLRQASPTQQHLAVEQHLLSRIEHLETDGPSGHRYHIKRYLETFKLLPPGKGTLLDLGGTCGLFDSVVATFTNYQLHSADHLAEQPFNFEKDIFPYQDESFDVVLFMEVLEHLAEDPMHAMSEINRILKPQGILLMSTPNTSSWRAIHRALLHQHPSLFPQYMRHGGTDRHNREYTYAEVGLLIEAAGFDIEKHEAIDVYDHLPQVEPIPGYDPSGRGDTCFCLARKNSTVRDRMPTWLYWPNP